MQNIRNAVDKREIIQYLKLREKRLHETIFQKGKSEKEIKILKVRHAEILRLISLINRDAIRKEIKNLHKHFAGKLNLESEYEKP